MKRVFLASVLLFVSLSGLADKTIQKVIKETKASGCDLSVHGFSSQESFDQYFEKLKQAAHSIDKAALSQLVHYPVEVFSKGEKMSIRSPEDLVANFDAVFSKKVLKSLSEQDKAALFCNADGAMYGDGVIWIQQRNKKMGIATVNNP